MSSLTIYGHLTPSPISEIQLDPRGLVRDHILYEAKLHEEVGFDGVLVGASAKQSDSLLIAACAAEHTDTLRFLVAHRPSVIAPTLAARQLATFDHLSGGRLLVHMITGRDGEQRQEGDVLTKDQRYERTAEHIQILKRAWTAEQPFTYSGRHFQIEGFRSDVRALQQPRIPISFAGDSPAAKAVGAAEADQYMLYAQPYRDLERTIEEISELSARFGRTTPPRFGIIARPILASTDELAWERANSILQLVQTVRTTRSEQDVNFVKAHAASPPSAGEQQMIRINSEYGARHDRALWTSLVGTTSRAMTASLVGSPDTVADALTEYVRLGVRTLLLFGYQPYEDAIGIGRSLLPRIRERVHDLADFPPDEAQVSLGGWALARSR
jgi:alkanesulfonate monooxygenase